jgi:hypothetical protein
VEAGSAPAEPQLFSIEEAYEEIVGGERPNIFKLVAQGVKFELPEGIKKGSLVKCEVVLRVGKKTDEDKIDSASGEVVDTIQTATGRFIEGKVLGPVGDLKPVK